MATLQSRSSFDKGPQHKTRLLCLNLVIISSDVIFPPSVGSRPTWKDLSAVIELESTWQLVFTWRRWLADSNLIVFWIALERNICEKNGQILATSPTKVTSKARKKRQRTWLLVLRNFCCRRKIRSKLRSNTIEFFSRYHNDRFLIWTLLAAVTNDLFLEQFFMPKKFVEKTKEHFSKLRCSQKALLFLKNSRCHKRRYRKQNPAKQKSSFL